MKFGWKGEKEETRCCSDFFFSSARTSWRDFRAPIRVLQRPRKVLHHKSWK